MRPSGAEFSHVDGHDEAVDVFAIWGTCLKTHLSRINLRIAINAYVIP
jgi:hypothetical protein